MVIGRRKLREIGQIDAHEDPEQGSGMFELACAVRFGRSITANSLQSGIETLLRARRNAYPHGRLSDR